MKDDECEFVQVRLRRAEKERWRKTARRLDLSVAQLVRRAVRTYATRFGAGGQEDDLGPGDGATR